MMPLNVGRQVAQGALIVASITIFLLHPSLLLAEAGSEAIQEVGLLRGLGIASALVGIIVLVLTQYVYRNKITRGTYHWLLLLALFVLPLTATLSTTATVMEGTKSVQACASCHVMHPFVNDLKDPSSPTLAARHYRNNWIAR